MPALRVHLDAKRHDPGAVRALMHLASEFPGPDPIEVEIDTSASGTRTITLGVTCASDDPVFRAAAERVLACRYE